MISNNFYESFLKPVISKKDSSDVAFCIRDKVYSYAQLFDAAEQIYDLVVNLPEDIIGLYATDDIRTAQSEPTKGQTC